jgi:pyruvate formate lyase activating enzyme
MHRKNGESVPCGEDWTVEALAEELLRNADIMLQSGGGVTFSGGEPLMQADFLLEILEILTREGIHTAVETSGYAPRDVFSAVARSASMVYMDLKLADPAAHRRFTGADNRLILENAAYLRASGTEHCFRTPLIPHITDTEENLAALAAVVGSSPWEKLPYNTLAGAKYPMLGRVYPYDEWRGEPS